MIYETKEISSELLSGLKPNNYTRRIKSHFAAYGTGYDFLHFYAVEESGEKLGIISVFNASMIRNLTIRYWASLQGSFL